MIDKIKELLKNEDLDFKRDNKKLKDYIMFKAKTQLNNENGFIDDETVLGWARHFYIETQKSIDNEMGKEKKKHPIEKVKKVDNKPKNQNNGNQLTIFDL